MTKKIFEFIENEKIRQEEHVELIASENYVSKNVLSALGSILTNKYAEGYPGHRYYGGCENVDDVETMAKELAQKLFNTNYYVNVQPHSGSSANMAVYLATLKVGDTVLGLSLSSGGHLTHGAFPSFSGEKYKLFNSISYGLDKNGYIDYEEVEKLAIENKPKLIIAGASAYSRKIDFKKFKEISDKVGAYLLVDMAHIAGLISANLHETPFGIADFITTTTHKTLRGPRGGMIFTKDENLSKKIDSAIFPGIQGGPLMNVIAAKAICFDEALSKQYKNYMLQVVKNAKVFEEEINKIDFTLKNGEKGKIKIVSNGTDNHLLLLDFRDLKLTGKEIENLLFQINITVNMNTVPGDENPKNPSGIRIGTPAITSRGVKEKGIKEIVKILKTVIQEQISNGILSEGTIGNMKGAIKNILKDLSIYPQI